MKEKDEKTLKTLNRGWVDWPEFAMGFPEWEPFYGFPKFRRAMGNMMKRFFEEHPFVEGVSAPEIDLYESEGCLVAEVGLPGIEKDNIQIHIDGDNLTVEGDLKKTEEIRQENFYRKERGYGKFSRSISLPKEIDPDKVMANFKDGLLSIKMPLKAKESPKGRKIDIE